MVAAWDAYAILKHIENKILFTERLTNGKSSSLFYIYDVFCFQNCICRTLKWRILFCFSYFRIKINVTNKNTISISVAIITFNRKRYRIRAIDSNIYTYTWQNITSSWCFTTEPNCRYIECAFIFLQYLYNLQAMCNV